MTTDELKAQCLAKAEEIARPHPNGTWIHHCGMECICGRDAEVQRIAEALEAMYQQGQCGCAIGIVANQPRIGW